MPAQKKTTLGLNQWIGNEYPKRIDFVEDNRITNDELEKRVKNTDLATDTEAGILTLNKVREVAPKPDLSPYQLKSNFWKYPDPRLKVVGTSDNGHSYTGQEIEMFNSSGTYQGTFHANETRAYYKVPNRAGGGWLEIMDHHDMAARDNLLQDVIKWHIRDIRLAGYINVTHTNQGSTERNGYVVTGVFNADAGNFSTGDSVQMRALQFFRNGQWLNVPFA